MVSFSLAQVPILKTKMIFVCYVFTTNKSETSWVIVVVRSPHTQLTCPVSFSNPHPALGVVPEAPLVTVRIP